MVTVSVIRGSLVKKYVVKDGSVRVEPDYNVMKMYIDNHTIVWDGFDLIIITTNGNVAYVYIKPIDDEPIAVAVSDVYGVKTVKGSNVVVAVGI